MIPLPFDPFDPPMLSPSRMLWGLLLLSPSEASFERRGFNSPSKERRTRLEIIGEAFIAGYNTALLARSAAEVRVATADIDPFFRGFAVEGSAMGVAVHDAFSLRRPVLPELLAEFDPDFTYLAHVGCGWAMARLPWRRTPILRVLDPVLRWLAFDGMGFHDTYFRPRRVLSLWRRVRTGYGGRAYDQGVGRALWFVCGGSLWDAVLAIRRFPPSRQGDLWAGLGLAMAYAGCGDQADFRIGLKEAASDRRHFAQGIAFACEARARAGAPPQVADLAAMTVCNMSALKLSRQVTTAREGLSQVDPDVPDYEVWRDRTSSSLAAGRLEAAE
ncbi:DUF1702 family protein [Mesorhizobium sp. ES1-6]|uniref:DUF1702 family protein n=1 Tax=Mesorhizobium sp. ES1-6 TaxID=2876626 RepID=UPI001CCE4870|nr:DUF1702 family protein [Mesorhizobium sp. ES1-6]MBZ9803449.1 DUF1702 family protein [Mesorhizobium sp. ES1-6]